MADAPRRHPARRGVGHAAAGDRHRAGPGGPDDRPAGGRGLPAHRPGGPRARHRTRRGRRRRHRGPDGGHSRDDPPAPARPARAGGARDGGSAGGGRPPRGRGRRRPRLGPGAAVDGAGRPRAGGRRGRRTVGDPRRGPGDAAARRRAGAVGVPARVGAAAGALELDGGADGPRPRRRRGGPHLGDAGPGGPPGQACGGRTTVLVLRPQRADERASGLQVQLRLQRQVDGAGAHAQPVPARLVLPAVGPVASRRVGTATSTRAVPPPGRGPVPSRPATAPGGPPRSRDAPRRPARPACRRGRCG